MRRGVLEKPPTSVLEALGHPQNQEKWEGHWVAGSLPCSVGLGHQPSSGSCHQGDEAAERYERQLELASAGDTRKANWWSGGSGKGHRTYRKLDGKAHDGFASLSYFLFSSVGGALDTILKLLGAFILQTQIKYKAISTSIIRKQWPSFSWLSVEPRGASLSGSDLGTFFLLSWPNADYKPNAFRSIYFQKDLWVLFLLLDS